MQYTENYSMNKPQFGENALVTKLNENADTLDTLIYNTRQMQADTYDSTQTYNTWDLVSYNSALYICLADNVTGAWDSTKWSATTLAEQVELAKQSGGGTTVVANPTGTASGTLESVGIDGTKYIVTPADMTGATSGAAGTHGLVPAPAAGSQGKYLKADGTWGEPDKAATWGQINGTLSNQSDLNAWLTGIDTRVDNLLNIPQGSTTADAALYDIKTGFDGVTYNSPGAAVRGCDQLLQDQIDPLYGYGDAEVSSTLNGYYNSATFTASETRYTLVYDVTDIDKVQASGTFLAYNNIYTLLNSSDTVIHYLTNSTSDYEYSGVIDVSDSAKLCVSAHANTIDSISVKFYQPAYIDAVKKVDVKVDSLEDHLIALLPLDINHVESGYYSNATKNTSSTWKSNYYDLSNVNFVKLVCNTNQYINEYTFLDGNGTPVKYKQATATSQTNEYEFDCSAYATLVMAEKDECVSYVFAYQNSAKHIPVRNDSNWVGKKIVWFGTSIPAGGYLGLLDPQSYPNILGKMLGCNMFNEAVGSSTVHCKINGFITEQNPYGYMPNFQSSSRCLSNDLTDMEYIITNYNSGIFTSQVPETMTEALAEQIRDCSWERKLNKYLGIGNRADLYVFDVGYNDIKTLESQYDPSDPTDRHTFTGAMNFLLEKIFADNPRAKVVMMGHYENQTENGVSVTNLQKTYAGMWLLDLYPLWEKTGFSQQIIKTTGYWNNDWGLWIDTSATEQSITALNMWLRDGVHPHSDYTHRTERYIAELIYPWINNIKGYDTRRNVKVEYPDPVTT